MIGRQIYNYKIISKIGEGGMSSVYLAEHVKLDRKVAVKVLHPVLARNAEIRERFKNEAATLSQIQHPNIVTLYDYIEKDSEVFLVMEYVEGKCLDDYITNVSGPLPEKRALGIFKQILTGVQYAHSLNIIHRDIKPSNFILSQDNDIKILDFGIAKILGESSKNLTKTGTKIGTVLYMSPEQVKGRNIDFRTDIYSLGITLFQMICGKCPYNNDSPDYEVYSKIVYEELPDVREYYPSVSESLVNVIKKATEKDPEKRFQTVKEFQEALKNIDTINSDKINSKTDLNKNNVHNKKSKALLTVFLVILILLCIAAPVYYFLFMENNENMYVLTTLNLRSSADDKSDDNIIETFIYGDVIEIIEENIVVDEKGLQWVKVKKESNEGFVAINYLGGKDEFEAINTIFKDDELKLKTRVVYKKSIAKYFENHDIISKENKLKDWEIVSANSILTSDLNNDKQSDYACILTNKTEDKYKLLIYLYENGYKARLSYKRNFNTEVKIEGIKKGTEVFFINDNSKEASDKFSHETILLRANGDDKLILFEKDEFNIYEYVK